MLRAAFKLPLRQTEGLMASVLTLMELTISAPDHTTVSRRAVTLAVVRAAAVPHGPLHVLIDSTGLQVYGAGQWLEAKHGAKSHRKWRKLHLAVDAASFMIVAQTLTDQDADDPSQVGPLLDQIGGPIGRVMADGAYDGAPTYRTIATYGDDIEVVIPPRSTAVTRGRTGLTRAAGPPSGDDYGPGATGLASFNRLRPTLAGRNDNGPLQVADRTATACPRLRSPADRGSHRRGGAEPDVGGGTPGLRPQPAEHRIEDRGWGSSRPYVQSAPTPSPAASLPRASQGRGLFSLRNLPSSQLYSSASYQQAEAVEAGDALEQESESDDDDRSEKDAIIGAESPVDHPQSMPKVAK